MTALQALRQSTRLTVTVLVWFVLTLAAAVAAPLLPSASGQVICSAAGRYVQPAADDAGSSGHARLHCPLCLTHVSAAPPAPEQSTAVLPLAQLPPDLDIGITRSISAVLPPARAPPVFL